MSPLRSSVQRRLKQESTSAERWAALFLRQAEQAPAVGDGALSQLVRGDHVVEHVTG
jgi:hypothetical protein